MFDITLHSEGLFHCGKGITFQRINYMYVRKGLLMSLSCIKLYGYTAEGTKLNIKLRVSNPQ